LVGSWELHHDSSVIDPRAAEQVSGELGRVMFWVHHASGPIALGILTVAAATSALGYLFSAFAWRWWLGSKWRQRREARKAAKI
jgi:hypothetical protein